MKPETGSDSFAAGTYYIAVPPITLTNGFSISFHAADEYCVYTRTSNQSNTFNRSKIKDFGTFKKTGNGWEWSRTSRGKVDASQEVDMGVFNIGGTNYRLIFTKSNLTATGTGLAASESDYGDYFAWGATEPWYSSITGTTVNAWKPGYGDGYTTNNYNTYISGKTIADNNVLNMEYDAARQKLGGDWQIPTQAIWYEFKEGCTTTRWNGNGYEFKNNNQTLFLPAAGYVRRTSFNYVNSYGYYWSGTASDYSSTDAYRLYFHKGGISAEGIGGRSDGFSVRPVRLVAE